MAGEKTEKATPRRRKEARKEGQVARTADLGAWASLLLIGMALPSLMGKELGHLGDSMKRAARLAQHPSTALAQEQIGQGLLHVFWVLLILSVMVMLIGVASALAQGGFALATKHAKPSFSKLNPLKGAKRIFGPQAAWEGVKILVKSSLVALVVYRAIKGIVPLVGGLMPMQTVLDQVRGDGFGLLRSVAIAGLAMAAADYAMQRRRVDKQTRMSKDDIKQEHKQQEGDPLLKGAIRSRQLAASRNRMMAAVADADVVLVNPTHVAVALKYEPATGAPRVVARGAGAIAAKIRERAAEERVPLVQDIPLARALYASTDVGQLIPPELFAAVASVLAFVITRRSQGQHGGEHRSPRRESELPDVPARGRRRRTAPNPSAPAPAGR